MADSGDFEDSLQRRYSISDYPKSRLTTRPNQQYVDLVPSRYEGRFAIVTSAGWDAVDAEALLTNGADAYGEVVWFWRLDAGVKPLRKYPQG